MEDFLKLSSCLYLFFIQSIYGSVILSSGPYCNSSSSNDGQSVQYAVPGTTISITCAVDNPDNLANLLTWTIPEFGVTVANSGGANATQSGFVSTINSADNTDRTTNATLTFTAIVGLDGLQVECSDVQSMTSSCTLLILTPPTVPVSPSCSDTTNSTITVVWYPPVDNGGEPVSHYTITQSSPGDTSTTTTTTTSTTTTITDLLPLTHYTFTISANNSQGYSTDSAVVNCTTVGNVFPPVSVNDVDICLGHDGSTDILSINITTQGCPPPNPDITTTPPFESYTITISGMELDPIATCSLDQPISEEDEYIVTVAVNNAVGASSPSTPKPFDSHWIRDITAELKDSVFNYCIVDCTTIDDADVVLTIPNDDFNDAESPTASSDISIPVPTKRLVLSSTQPFESICSTFDVSALSSTGSYSYTLLVTRPGTIIASYTGSFETVAPSTRNSDPTSTSTSTRRTPESPTAERSSDLNLPVIAGGVAGGVIAVLVAIIIILLVVYCVCLKSKSDSVEFLGTKRGDDPIPLKDTSMKPPAHAQPETGQGFYQDPNTIERQQAPTGDMYSVPEKGSKRRAPPQQPESATYQDPNTIQRQQAPTGDIYTQPQQKPVYSKVNKDNKQQGSEYAELDLEGDVGSLKSPTQKQPLIHNQDRQQQAVLYSDVRNMS